MCIIHIFLAAKAEGTLDFRAQATKHPSALYVGYHTVESPINTKFDILNLKREEATSTTAVQSPLMVIRLCSRGAWWMPFPVGHSLCLQNRDISFTGQITNIYKITLPCSSQVCKESIHWCMSLYKKESLKRHRNKAHMLPAKAFPFCNAEVTGPGGSPPTILFFCAKHGATSCSTLE